MKTTKAEHGADAARSGVKAIPSRWWTDEDWRAWELAQWTPRDDPRDLAKALGLRPCPTRTETAFVRDGRLHYPEAATMEERGRQIVALLVLAFPNETSRCGLRTVAQ